MPDVRHIQGLDALQKYLARIPADVSKKVLRVGASEGSKVVKDYVEQRTPVGPSRKGHVGGTLKRALRRVFARDKSNDGQAVFRVTYRKGKAGAGKLNRKGTVFTLPTDAFYAFWVEQGHRIVGRNKVGATHRTLRQRRAASGGNVPGVHMMEQGFNASRDAAEHAMVVAMQNEIRSVL